MSIPRWRVFRATVVAALIADGATRITSGYTAERAMFAIILFSFALYLWLRAESWIHWRRTRSP